MRVLIIDDEEDVRRVAFLSLARIGRMDVIGASSGAEGIEKAAAIRPDVVLLDVMMPDMDGPTALAALRARPETADIPVVFITAHAMEAKVEMLRSLGARAVLIKPFDVLTLPDELRKALE